MKKVLFVDLDDTLFQSHRKQTPSELYTPLAFLEDGQPVSYASPTQISTLKMLQQQMTVIPVTARNKGAFDRVKINFTAGAVLNYGGIVIDAAGEIDPVWRDKSRMLAHQSLPMLEQIQQHITGAAEKEGATLSVRMITDCDIPFYIVIKSTSNNLDAVSKIAIVCEKLCLEPGFDDFRVHANGNNIAIMPKWLNKRHAVAYLKEQFQQVHPNIVTFGMGDSLIDLGFMNECQYMIVPTGTQIADKRMKP